MLHTNTNTQIWIKIILNKKKKLNLILFIDL